MSLRAYKIIEIKTEAHPTFGLNNDKLWEWLENCGATETLNIDGCGLLTLPRDVIEAAITEAKKRKDYRVILDDLKLMLKDCGNDDYVEYYCY